MKKLPFVDPEIKCYQHHAAGTAIIKANATENEFLQYLSGNFIQVKYRKPNHITLDFDFFTPLSDLSSPLLNTLTVPRDYAKAWANDIIEYVIKNIDNGYYVYTPVSVRYIKEYNVNTVNYHPILIYGYNDEKAVFYAADYFSRYFETAEVPFTEFKNAYNDVKPDVYWWNGIKLLAFNNKDKYNLEIKNVINLLEDYLYSRDTSMRYRMDRNYDHIQLDFGINIYNRLRFALANQSDTLDIIAFATLIEHKKVLARVSAFIFPALYEQNLKCNIDKIIDNTAKLQNIVMKHQLAPSTALIERCDRILYEIEKEEHDYITELLKLLREYKQPTDESF